MKTFKSLLLATAFSATLLPMGTFAADETYTFNDFTLGGGSVASLPIPDGNLVGVSDTRVINSSSIFDIASITVSLDLSGSWNGDLYAYLRYENGGTTAFSVLLNRVGVGSTNPIGAGDPGMNVVLSSSAANEIHNYPSLVSLGGATPLTGTWQPDGRSLSPVSPATSFDGAARDAQFDVFNGLDANGTWTLFFADVSASEAHSLEGWSLTIEPAIPEASTIGFATAFLLPILTLIWRRRAMASKI